MFSGIGAFEKALERLQIPFDLVGFSEIDKYAIKSYCAIHNVNENLNLGDVSKIDENNIPDCDLMTWGFPCQDISVAGKQKGVVQGKTRSGLYYEGLRILKAKKPKYTIIENVKALTQTKFKDTFNQILSDLDIAGYNIHWKILNAKDFGVPQNRERVFIVGIKKDVNNTFDFPTGKDIGIRLKDVLEIQVDEKYYIDQDKVNRLLENMKNFSQDNEINVIGRLEDMNGNDICKRVYSETGISPTIPTGSSGNTIPKIIQSCSFRTRSYQNQPQQLEIRKDEISNAITTVQKDSMVLEQQGIQFTRKGISKKVDIYNTLTANDPIRALGNNNPITGILCKFKYLYRIRKLIPLECWRLMGFSDEDFHKAKEIGTSNCQLYKQAGNSIVVNVVESIMKNLLYDYIQYVDIA